MIVVGLELIRGVFCNSRSIRYVLQKKGFDREFISHEQIFEWGNDKQDMLIKIVITRKERVKILSHLKEMNINHFSLFQSEESLMQALAFEGIEVEK